MTALEQHSYLLLQLEGAAECVLPTLRKVIVLAPPRDRREGATTAHPAAAQQTDLLIASTSCATWLVRSRLRQMVPLIMLPFFGATSWNVHIGFAFRTPERSRLTQHSTFALLP